MLLRANVGVARGGFRAVGGRSLSVGSPKDSSADFLGPRVRRFAFRAAELISDAAEFSEIPRPNARPSAV